MLLQGLARGEAEHLRVLTQPGVDVAFDHRAFAIQAHRLAMATPAYEAMLTIRPYQRPRGQVLDPW